MRHYLPIEDYGLIGNLHTVALVSRTGSIDYLPFTRFDSPTIFAALLDKDKGGYWQLAPVRTDVRYQQQYLPDTGVLLTRFFTPEGMAEITDFMPVKHPDQPSALVRTLRVLKGEIAFRMELRPRFDYARAPHETEQQAEALLFRSTGPDGHQFRLLSSQPLTLRLGDVTGTWTLAAGAEASFVLEEVLPDPEEGPPLELAYYAGPAFEETMSFWQQWADSSSYSGRWRETVLRSAITLKLLTCQQYGSTVAAATFGLPATIGAGRNWDYRYTWIRDTAFTMYAFLRLGFTEEAKGFIRWLMDRCESMEDASELQLLYAVDGSSQLDELVLDHLEGYRKSAPVRIGNAAAQQFQLDIYGELIDTIYLYNKDGGPITYAFWQYVSRFVDYVAANWQRPDQGIWEVRSAQQEFIYSKIMAWVALDRGILIAQTRSFPAPLEEWRRTRDAIYQDVYDNYWNPDLQAFVQYRGADVLDAAVLLMPLVHMFSPAEPRWLSTLKAVEEQLVTDSLVYRYKLTDGADDGLSGEEGTFSICSFWYIECLARGGQVAKARLYFEKMLGYANHLGLYSEQLGTQGEQLGNFPQAFTHLALISAAYQLNRDLSSPHDQTTPHARWYV
ncbi:glycoside hydrolase family 15 protein [Hymenobacter volaticus]|uniref:Glycoside hydrolase family 15 protein n=1 Tax=Hymenobacter volaticus TaxID=2932254 RepID=A0ABY4GFI6_9BACT|nr:glycoside hydrolase family 15 protein [Hymenobacter volaticus]UOQ69690.1 glycoside hydrolase family 15 protein [Hymenobacter volaticus]